MREAAVRAVHGPAQIAKGSVDESDLDPQSISLRNRRGSRGFRACRCTDVPSMSER
jgi:hypothetical protein